MTIEAHPVSAPDGASIGRPEARARALATPCHPRGAARLRLLGANTAGPVAARFTLAKRHRQPDGSTLRRRRRMP